MKASRQAQESLLRLQDLDLTLDQLAFRRANLPDHARLAELASRIEATTRDEVRWKTKAGDLQRQVQRVECDVEQVRARIDRDRSLLDSGSISSGKQLADLGHEIESLTRRIGDLEDTQLEVMEELEDAAGQADAAMSELVALGADHTSAAARLGEKSAEIDAASASAQADREEIIEAVPADLAALYLKLRAQHGGVGAARLRHGRCEGCHLQLPPTEYARLGAAPADEVARCEECRRILVRQEG